MTDDQDPLPECTIALVDDDRNILASVSIALQSEGFRTRLYPDGESALKALAANPADLGIFDIKMPRFCAGRKTDEMPSLKTFQAERRQSCGGGWKWIRPGTGCIGTGRMFH